eukprot:PhF_6_TR31233/c0_g1_i1/m.45781
MFRRNVSTLNRFNRLGRYPYQIEYHRLPWKCVQPSTPDVHQHCSDKYHQLLELASRTTIPLLVNDFHPSLESDQAKAILPGTVYILPEVRTLLEDPAEWGPFQWTGTKIDDTLYTMHYGRIEGAIAPLQELWEFTSTDLQMLCTALCFGVPKGHCCNGSTLHALQQESKDFVLFHFYRPNRPVSELIRPLEKYYVQKPCMCAVHTFAESSWTPAPLPKREKNAVVTPMEVSAPTEVWMRGIPEREGLKPGNCIGHRRNAWG